MKVMLTQLKCMIFCASYSCFLTSGCSFWQVQLRRFISSRPSTAASMHEDMNPEDTAFITQPVVNENDLRVASVTPSEIEQIDKGETPLPTESQTSLPADNAPDDPGEDIKMKSAEQTPEKLSPESEIDISEAYRYPVFAPRDSRGADYVETVDDEGVEQ